MRRLGLFLSILASGCSEGSTSSAPDAVDPAAAYIETAADDKALLYNLIGRWYPDEEIERLSDRTLTPEQWCEREPSTVFIYPDKVEVRCPTGVLHSAMISATKREKDGTIAILLRAKEDSKLKQIRVHATGPKALIAGSPCFDREAAPHARFPEFEMLSREILGGRRCAQVAEEEAPSISAPLEPAP